MMESWSSATKRPWQHGMAIGGNAMATCCPVASALSSASARAKLVELGAKEWLPAALNSTTKPARRSGARGLDSMTSLRP